MVDVSFCNKGCELAWNESRARRARLWATFLTYLADIPRRLYTYRPLYYLGGTDMTTMRPDTPPRYEGGKTIVTNKRSCNGCGQVLGDATEAELEAAVNGRPLPDARKDCLHCSASVSIADVAIGDDVLYHAAAASKWIAGVVEAIAADGALRIRLGDAAVAAEVKHGFGGHEWCTLDEMVEHRKVAARDNAEAGS
jgi:hypothetical protein